MDFVLCSSEEDSSSTVEALLFSPAEQNLLITGSLEGIINVWDLSSQVSKVHEIPLSCEQLTY